MTESVTGVDLVRLQFQIAQGSRCLSSSRVTLRGHAIEARLYAEDPAADFLPSTGRLAACRPGKGRACGSIRRGDRRRRHALLQSAARQDHWFWRDARRSQAQAQQRPRGGRLSLVWSRTASSARRARRARFVEGRATTGFFGGSRRRRPPEADGASRSPRFSFEGAGARAERGLARLAPEARRRGGERLISVGARAETRVAIGGEAIAFVGSYSRDGEARFAGRRRVAVHMRWRGRISGSTSAAFCRRFFDRDLRAPRRKEATPTAQFARRSAASSSRSRRKPATGSVAGKLLATVEAMKMHY